MAGKNDNIEVEEISKIEEGVATFNITKHENKNNIGSASTVAITQKLLAEAIGTFYIVFAGCGSIAVDKIYGSVTFPGICVTWGLIIMVMIYSLAHISGAHFNPAVSITLSIFRRFPLWQVPFYVIAQLIGATLASYVLSLILDVTPKAYFGTVPVGSNVQALVTEIIISSTLMFVIFGAVEDNRGFRQLGGIAVGMTITLNALVAGQVSGASMNPARSIGPAIVKNHYQGLWIYVVGPIGGTIIGGSAYSLLGSTDKPLGEVSLYVIAQLIGATLASYVLSLILDVTPKAYFGTVPVGSNVQALVTEIIISSTLMFVIFGAVEDNRGIRQLGGIAVGLTITLNALVAGQVSGASMNPARSVGPAIVKNHYQGIWIYIVGPIGGTIIGGSAYSLLESTDKPLGEVTESTSFLKTNS